MPQGLPAVLAAVVDGRIADGNGDVTGHGTGLHLLQRVDLLPKLNQRALHNLLLLKGIGGIPPRQCKHKTFIFQVERCHKDLFFLKKWLHGTVSLSDTLSNYKHMVHAIRNNVKDTLRFCFIIHFFGDQPFSAVSICWKRLSKE